ncbi:hypothetical protein G9A89_006884 [Geosiphon pyriformis]|nr:hypothetical protein G9A89_006884 [Geosiphon pyriformis]
MSLVLGEMIFFKCVSSLRHYDIAFIEQLCDWNGISLGFGVICNDLLNVGATHLSVYTDGSLSNLDIVDMLAYAAVFFEDINLGLGVGVSGLVSSTLMELQAIALALECVPSFSLHHHLSVAVQKCLYDRGYPNVVCLFCGEVEVSDHVFSCSSDTVMGKLGGFEAVMLKASVLEWRDETRVNLCKFHEVREHEFMILISFNNWFISEDEIEKIIKDEGPTDEILVEELTFTANETLATYFQELNFNIIEYCEEKYPVHSKYSFDFESKTKTSNKGKQRLKQYSRTTPNTPTLQKTTAKHLQTPEQGTKDFTLLRSPIRQQESLQTSSNLLDFLAENRSKYFETAVNEKNDSKISEEESIDSENEEDKMTTYITKIPEFNGENIETSPQEWLNQNAARMLRTIPYFLKKTTGKWFKNLTTLFNDWTAFKTAFLEQFTDNNTSITL